MDRDSKVPGVLDLGHFMPEFKRLTSSPSDVIDEIQYTRRDRLSREAMRNRVDLALENELRSLIAKEEREVKEWRRDGLTSDEIVWRRNSSDTSKRIKGLLKKFKIAKMNTAGDWIINRKSEIPESMGTVTFTEVMQLIDQFKMVYGDGSDDQLIALDLGCGNGEFCEELRTEPGHKWEIYGYADCIYFNLKDFIHNLLRREFAKDSGLEEFVNVISTLIIRAIHEIEAYSGGKTDEQDILRLLPQNLGVIRRILLNLQDYIDIKDKKSIKVDLEFLSDAEREISPDCQDLIASYLNNPKDFVEFYFIEEAQDLSPEDKNRMRGIQAEMAKIKQSFRRQTRSLTRKIGKVTPRERKTNQDQLEAEWKERAKRSTLVANQEKLKALTKEKDKILAKIPNLAPYISLYYYNVIPGSFDELDAVIPEASLSFISAFRSTSHLGHGAYWKIMKIAATRLAPGGAFLDDGKRESWTRYERISLLESLQEELGADFQVRIIANGEKPTAVLIERAIEYEGKKVFFSDKLGHELLKEGHELVDVHEWVTKLPTVYVRNKVIEVIRDALVDATYEGLRGRLYFKGVHPIIDSSIQLAQKELEFKVSNLSQITEGIKKGVLFALKREGTPEVKRLLQEAPVPEKRRDTISTMRRTQKIATLPRINRVRSFTISDLPRNRDIPSNEALHMRKLGLVRDLELLRQPINRPPITVCEFDDCFTNRLMIDLLHEVLDDACFMQGIDFDELIRVYNIRLQGDRYAQSSTLGIMNIIGGSTGDVYDEYGERFTDHFVRPLLDEVAGGAPARFLGICFGSQSILQAFGKQQGMKFYTAPGALQFGAFPVSFSNNIGSDKQILNELSGASYTVSMTRGSYSLVDGYDKLGEELISPLAFEYNNDNGRMEVDRDLPPVAFSLYGGKVVTAQFHPEISLRAPEAHHELNAWLKQNQQHLKEEYEQMGAQVPGQFDLDALKSWVQKDIGPLFLLNTLSRQIHTLLQELHLR